MRTSHFHDAAADKGFARLLLCWYDAHKRDLPWRVSQDPYRIWVSEIMLQQTRVAAVVGYYEKFLNRFPTLEKLARARMASVLAAWSGLGYYRRARAMHAAAKQIVKQHGGIFPPTSAQLETLPGVGRYTASAIASIAFGEPVAVVDGNVERVLQRFLGKQITRGETWRAAQNLLSVSHPGDFNQAMMELGAMVCLPRGPNCLLCPLASLCATRGELPQRRREVRRKRKICYGLHTKQDAVWLVQRPGDAPLMAGMWELPENSSNGHEHLLTLKHSITVTDYTVSVMRTRDVDVEQGRWVSRSRLQQLPLTGLTRKILRAAKFI
jgi:A/G-specific adenine glycosylase